MAYLIKEQSKEVLQMDLTKEQMSMVQRQMQPVGLVMAYYTRFGDDALKVAEDYFAQAGRMAGANIKSSLNISGSDAQAVSAVLDAFLLDVGGIKGASKIEGNKVIIENDGFCPVMETVKALDAPWDKIDHCYGWPFIEGIAAGVNPDVTMEVTQTRHRGDKSCKHVFIVP